MLIDLAREITLPIALQSPKVYQVKQSLGEQSITKLVVFILKNFCDSLNLKEPIKAVQLIEIANSFIDTYTHSSIDDLILCLKNAKANQYGPIFGRIDQQTIFGFLQKYEDEKAEYLEHQNLNRKAQEASNQKGMFYNMPEEVQEAIKNMTREKLETPKAPLPSAVPSEQEYKEKLIALLPTMPIEALEQAKDHYAAYGQKEFVRLVNDEINRRD